MSSGDGGGGSGGGGAAGGRGGGAEQVGLVLRVLVPPEVDFSLEGAVARVAGERFVAGVLAHVRDQVRRLAERLAADAALVGLLACGVR